jgi:very-short-patch-repair endonuclease
VTWRSTPEKRDLAREFRRAPTDAERLAWELLRDRRLLGLKFRRQQVLEGFVADFYCAELRLVLEIDGGAHASAEARSDDAERTRALEAAGHRVLRVDNDHLTKENLLVLLSPLSRSGEGARG